MADFVWARAFLSREKLQPLIRDHKCGCDDETYPQKTNGTCVEPSVLLVGWRPHEHHPALPVSVLLAMMTTALYWVGHMKLPFLGSLGQEYSGLARCFKLQGKIWYFHQIVRQVILSFSFVSKIQRQEGDQPVISHSR